MINFWLANQVFVFIIIYFLFFGGLRYFVVVFLGLVVLFYCLCKKFSDVISENSLKKKRCVALENNYS